MKTTTAVISLVILLAILPGCREERTLTPAPGDGGIRGVLVETNGCKTAGQLAFEATAGADNDCIEYEYTNGTLKLDHINAAFNCCPGEITAGIEVDNGVITITDAEGYAGCHCLCLFDLRMEIENLPADAYTIRVIELYLEGEDERLEFDIDLTAATSGTHCVTRDHYPWQGGGVSEPGGRIVGHTGCKSMLDDPATGLFVPPDLDCMRCWYLEGGILLLTHYNAGFNCCWDEIVAEITVENGRISIEESEIGEPCDCLCLFDVDYEITGIEPGAYTVSVREPYAEFGDEPLEFELELPCEPGYCFCVPRNHYPWKNGFDEEDDIAVRGAMCAKINCLVGIPRCGDGDDCRILPLGSKPCGGPWSYLIASAGSERYPDVVTLVHIYNEFEDLMNMRYGYASDCSIPGPPIVQCVGGICTAVGEER